LTKEDYESKRKLLADKLKTLFEDENSDDEKLYKELYNIEASTLGEPTRSLVGKVDPNPKLDQKEATELCRQMVDKLNEDKKQRKERLRQLKLEKKERKEKMKKELQSRREAEEKKKLDEFEQKQNTIREKITQRQEYIQKSKTQMVQETKKRVRRSPMHSQIELEFKEKYEMPELEQRKQQLAQIRNFHQPIRLTNIKQHAEEKKELLKQKLQEFFKRREYLAECNKDNRDKYNSKFWKIVKSREEQDKLKEEKNKEDLHNRHWKKIEYAKNVTHLYKPTVSKRKQMEMNLIKQNLTNPHSLSSIRKGTRSTKNDHNKSMVSPTEKGISTDATSQMHKRRALSKTKPLDDKRYSYHPKAQENHRFVKYDYLTQDRLKREDHGDRLYKLDTWNAELNRSTMNENEKIEYIKHKSAQVEEEMSRKEALLKAKNCITIDESKKIDSLLIESIKNKLDFLGDLDKE
jgi:hypothetical protein